MNAMVILKKRKGDFNITRKNVAQGVTVGGVHYTYNFTEQMPLTGDKFWFFELGNRGNILELW
jgi:hypothetical protein